MTPQSMPIYKFGPFQLDFGQRVLMRDGEIVPLTPKAFDTLFLLVQNCGRVLQKEEMMRSIWPNCFVEEATLAQNVFTLRKVLGETPTQARYIETIPRRGYRFIAKVSEITPDYDTRPAVTYQAGPPISDRVIAVLPFRTLTSSRGNEYFGLGMADALITRLSNIKDVVVRPTSAVLKYHREDQDLFAASQELKVRLALEGTVQMLDDRIRVTVQLVNIESRAPLWAEKFDEKFSDVFAVQDIISEQVARSLTLELTSSQRMLLTKRHTRNSEAYRDYLKGRYFWSKWTEEGFKKSIEFFERAIEMEPTFTLPYAGLADTYTTLCFYSFMPPHQAMPQVKMMAQKALDLDNQLAEARLSLAGALFFYDWDWDSAEKEFKRTIEINPSYALAHQGYGLFLVAMKRFHEAESSFNLALELDPVSPLIKTSASFPYYYSGQYEKALKHYLSILEEEPNFPLTHVALGDVYAQQGKFQEAISEYQKGAATAGVQLILPYIGYVHGQLNDRKEALRIVKDLIAASETQYISPLSIAIVYAGLKDRGKIYKWLEKAFQERSNKLVFLAVQPHFEYLRTEKRFMDLLAMIGLEA